MLRCDALKEWKPRLQGRASYLGAPPILACMRRSVGRCRKTRRQGWAALPGN